MKCRHSWIMNTLLWLTGVIALLFISLVSYELYLNYMHENNSRTARDHLEEQIELLLLLLLLPMLSFWFYYTRRLIRSLQVLRQHTADVFLQLFGSEIPNSGGDEIGAALQGFGVLSERTLQTQADLHDTQQRLLLEQANLKQVVQTLKQQTQEMILLNELSDRLQSCLDFDEACAVIQQFGELIFPDSCGVVFSTAASRNRLESIIAWGPQAHTVASFAPNDCWALRRGKPHHHRPGEMGCRHINGASQSDCLCWPMMAHGETIGLLYLEDPQPIAADGEAQSELVKLMEAFVGDIAQAMANLKLRETLQAQSIRDPLTSLYNRRYMVEILEREQAIALRNESSLALIMLDIDHFKQFNDHYGHAAGDALLMEVGQLLGSQVRAGDIACRYGGEEFLLVLPGATLQQAEERAEQLRQAIQALSVTYQGGQLDQVTASFGVAALPLHGVTGTVVMEQADAALYTAKREGRNRVAAAQPNTSSAPMQR